MKEELEKKKTKRRDQEVVAVLQNLNLFNSMGFWGFGVLGFWGFGGK